MIQILAVARKADKITAKIINMNERKQITEKCIATGWGIPTFYQLGYSTYEKLIKKQQ